MLTIFWEFGRRKWVAEVVDRMTGVLLYKTAVHPRKRDAGKDAARWIEEQMKNHDD